MHVSWASWLLVACMGTTINASNILEVDLVFPRNETYAPTESFPVVFAFQNPERARYLNPHISYSIWNLDEDNGTVTRYHDFRSANWTGNGPYLAHEFFTLSNEGRWRVRWTLTWQSCNEYAFENHLNVADMIRNTSTWSTWFTIQSSAPNVDLVAATANKTCPGEYGVTIDVTNKTMQVPRGVDWSGGDYTNGTCAVVASSAPTPKPDPCRVNIDKTIVASIEASLKTRLCNGLNPPTDCPEDNKNAAQQLVVTSIFCLLAAFGALGVFMM
ncbi:hypothetical protein N7489_005192 [Penicillium chrysogenum]|uniref:DUF7136 domain-containing protein n=1 Tax=Penicillium chrysogenum TaxID=5076 RepID=A0ABQ8WQQ1_PENCH|nr:uncharacterized protein N7489_005192 [Penicillium chrysogenum]KAJ5245096.1 hypothetical protein N7489_005192 [Penicillium chrysogenum]KAJ5274805.1 hypothetical protein N7505_003350 [Penicillium chrysogenum]KAJ6156526.1 hypothetical protein N7497_005411 [Penicillium chrysogenum]